VEGSEFVQSSNKTSTLVGNSGVKIGTVASNLGVLLSDTGIELSLNLHDESMSTMFPGGDLSFDSLEESVNLGEEHGLLGGNPVDSLGSASSSESIDLFLSWCNSAESLWHHTINFSAKFAGSSF